MRRLAQFVACLAPLMACGGGGASSGALRAREVHVGDGASAGACPGMAAGRWVPMASAGDPGNIEGPPPLAAWTGERAVIIRRELGGAHRAATFDPCANAWTSVSLDPSARHLVALSQAGPRTLLWHGGNGIEAALELDGVARAFVPAPASLLAPPLFVTGPHAVTAGGDASFVDFAQTQLVDLRTGDARPAGGEHPGRLNQHGMAALDDALFVWGGWANPPGRYEGGGALLDAATGTWAALPEGGPSARAPGATARVGGAVVVWGGRGPDAWLADGAVYDLAARRWRPTTSVGAPAPRNAALVVATSDRLVLLGGHAVLPGGAGAQLADGATYDPVGDRWRTFALPHPNIDAIWTRAHVLGDGRVLVRHRDLAWASLLDPRTGAWTPVDVGPVAGRAQAAVVWTGRLLVVWGGVRVGRELEGQCTNVPPDQGCDPVGPDLSYPPGGAMISF